MSDAGLQCDSAGQHRNRSYHNIQSVEPPAQRTRSNPAGHGQFMDAPAVLQRSKSSPPGATSIPRKAPQVALCVGKIIDGGFHFRMLAKGADSVCSLSCQNAASAPCNISSSEAWTLVSDGSTFLQEHVGGGGFCPALPALMVCLLCRNTQNPSPAVRLGSASAEAAVRRQVCGAAPESDAAPCVQYPVCRGPCGCRSWSPFRDHRPCS